MCLDITSLLLGGQLMRHYTRLLEVQCFYLGWEREACKHSCTASLCSTCVELSLHMQGLERLQIMKVAPWFDWRKWLASSPLQSTELRLLYLMPS